MAVTTRISDGFTPDVWYAWMAKDTTEKTSIFTSGIIQSNAELAAKLGGGGTIFQMPTWKDMGDDEPDSASDDPALENTPEKLGSIKDQVRRIVKTHAISVADLTPIITGGDPMARMRSRFGEYWARHFQRSLVHMFTGIFQDNITNDASDMVVDIATDTALAITDDELIGAESIMDTAQTMGDAKDLPFVLIMHSDVQTRLAKQELIDFVRDSQGNILFPTYLGYRVIMDDGVRHLVAGTDTTNRDKYWTYLVAPGAVAWAEVPTDMPAEVERKPSQGKGMGVEILHNRRQYAMHVPGIAWVETSVADDFPSYADLRNPLNHNRVYVERKQIPIAALVTNG